jgi:hypothetical protein
MNADDFEQVLQRQRPRPIPPEWREDILSAASGERTRALAAPLHPTWLETLNSRLSAIFWPSPKAWVGLAAAWVVVFSIQFGIRDPRPAPVAKVASSSPEVQRALKQQHELLVELIGAPPPAEAGRPKPSARQPRGEVWPGLLVA